MNTKKIRLIIRKLFCDHSLCRYKKYKRINGISQELEVRQCFYCGRKKSVYKVFRGDKGQIIGYEKIKNGKKLLN